MEEARKLRNQTHLHILLVGAAALTIRTLMDSRFGTSGLLYIAVPYAIATLLYLFTEFGEGRTEFGKYVNTLRNGTIIMLATSAILFEGFLCVLMFMPIFYVSVTLGFFGAVAMNRYAKKGTNRASAHLLPVFVIALSMDGTTPQLTYERAASVTQTRIVDADIPTLKLNMAEPIHLSGSRHWFLKLFPLPTSVEAGTLNEGDIHVAHFEYRRWLVTNIHRGEVHLKIEEVSDRRVRTRIVRNDSYLAGYMSIDGTQVDFRPLPDGRTEVALTVNYERALDPAWYFGPMQRFAVEQSAHYLIEQVIAR